MIVLKQGDITQENVDAIVNAANSGLKGGGGVDGAIHRAGGPSILKECRKFGGCKTGEAVITTAGKLKAIKVIHAVGPVWYGGRRGEEGLLRSAYENSFLVAKKYGMKSIAFPAISTGVYGYPKEKATKIALEAGKRFEKDFDEIRFICFSEGDLELYRKVWGDLGGKP